jgi:hypothetical protein
MKTILLTALVLLAATPTWAGNMPKELLGEWCQAENHGDTQIYSRAPSINCKKSVLKLHILEVGLLLQGKPPGVICAAPRDFEKEGTGTRFKAACGFSDNSSSVQTFNFFMYPVLKKSLAVVID